MNGYERFCFNLIGRDVKEKRGDFVSLRNDLTGARMNTPCEAYLATAYVSSIAVGLVAAALIGILTYALRVPEMISYHGAVPEVFYALNAYKLLIGTVVITLLSLLIFGGITYLIFLLYPGIRAGERRRNIDATLPYAINYVTAMSSAGITPDEVFRLLGQSRIYGESAVEGGLVRRAFTRQQNVRPRLGKYVDAARPGINSQTGHGLSLIHISEPTRLLSISYAVFCLKKKRHRGHSSSSNPQITHHNT